uniref:Maf-like protein n=1 Tax=Panagrolaimus sp. PS1159 TaxID=55785 RepID=A0AC35GTN7_9BILA
MDVKWLLGEASKDPVIFVADNSEDRLVHFQRIGINARLLLSSFEADKLYDNGLPPISVAKRSAEAKAHDVAEQLNRKKETYDMIIGFHTVVAMDNKIIPKPLDRDEALKILKQLNNRWHSIITGVSCLSSSQTVETFAVETKIKYGNIPDELLEGYVESDEWTNQNAAYDIYRKASAFIESTNGCFYNILGIPIFEVAKRIRHLMLDGGKSEPSLASESALIQQNVEGAISNENINVASFDHPSTETCNDDNTNENINGASFDSPSTETCNDDNTTPTTSRSSLRRFTTPLPFQRQTHHKQNQAASVKESPASPAIIKDEYSSTFYRTIKRPGLSDLRRAGIEVSQKQIENKPSLASESALIQQNVEGTISNENIYAIPTSSRSSLRRFTTPLPSQQQTHRKQNQAAPVKESSASPAIKKDEYSSTFYRATGRPGLSDLRRAGIEPPKKQNDPVHSYKYSPQDDWG